MRPLSPVSAAAANGVVSRTRYAATVRSTLAILITLVACQNPDIARMAAIQKTVCACKTASCAEQEMKRVPAAAIKSTHRTQELARDLLDCLARLQAGERPSTDPDDEVPGEPETTNEGPNEGPNQGPNKGPNAPPTGPRTAAPASAETR
jgi:hypothetical protein